MRCSSPIVLISFIAHQGRPECEPVAEQECTGTGYLRMLYLRVLVGDVLVRM